jgi:hypothetical protein
LTKSALSTTERLPGSTEPAALLEELLGRYPLGAEWSRPRLFTETVSLGTLRLNLCGLSTESSGEGVTGSAANLDHVPLLRAYFELVERATLVSAGREPNRKFIVKDVGGRTVSRAPSCRVFPQSTDPARRFARSNGVAVGASWTMACRAAHWELVERDRVLRSWYGETRPCPLALPSLPWLGALEEYFDLLAYVFPEASGDRHGTAIGVFSFPRSDLHPLAYGFAADRTSARAFERAAAECLQRLGFLWGEELPTEEPQAAPTAEYHQEVYLQPRMCQRVREWLAGVHARTPCTIQQRADTSIAPEFADLTPEPLRGEVFVAKALPRCEVDLIFGRGHPAVLGPVPEAFQVHPIA